MVTMKRAGENHTVINPKNAPSIYVADGNDLPYISLIKESVVYSGVITDDGYAR
jgi:hypothetical protein